MKHLKLLSGLLIMSAISACHDSRSTVPAMTFNTDGAATDDIYVSYSPYNDPNDQNVIKLPADSSDRPILDVEFPEGIKSFDATVTIGDRKYGAHLEKGEMLTADIAIGSDGNPTVSYSGKNAAISRVLTRMLNGFDVRSYFPPDLDSIPPLTESLKGIDSERDSYAQLLGEIEDRHDREYYSRYLTRHVDAIKTLVIRIYANVTQTDCDTIAEYRRIVGSINPDDEIDVRTQLYDIWLNDHIPADGNIGNVQYFIASMHLIDSVMTDPHNRRTALNAVSESFLSIIGMPKEEMTKFNEAYAKYASDFPDIVEKTDKRIARLTKVLSDGDSLPYDPTLLTPDGESENLSQMYGKILYIDFWATWCGPCCGEIPYMEKLYNRLKDNAGIELISISLDENEAAWLDKLAEDRPGWPQYRLSADQNEKLSKALNINGIPRFVIIGPDGKFISTYAPRPSDPEIFDLLTSLIGKK